MRDVTSPTHGLEKGALVTVRGALVAHHVDGQPYISFRSIKGAQPTPVWVNPDDIVDAPAPPPKVLSRSTRALRWLTGHRYGVLDLGWLIPAIQLSLDGRPAWALAACFAGVGVSRAVTAFAERQS